MTVAVAFVLCSLGLLLLALRLAQTDGPAHAVRALGLTIAYLTLFNIAYFQLVNVRRQFWRAWGAAIGVFVCANLIASQSLTTIPKGTVNALGLGNFYAPSVTLSSLQCPMLALYGVACESKKDDAIVLTNVNILNKMGSTVTLELQVRRGDLDTPADDHGRPTQNGTHDSETPNRVALHAVAGEVDFVIGDRGKQRYIEARKCDEALGSWLKAPRTPEPLRTAEREKYKRMWCVTLNVSKTQFLGDTRDGIRTYRGGYTEFMSVKSTPSKM